MQIVDAFLHPGKLFVNQSVRVLAIRAGVRQQIQQLSYIVQRHVQGATVANECQSLQVRDAVVPVSIGPARRQWQQACFLVIAHGIDLDGGTFCQFTDPHIVFLHCPRHTSIDHGVTPGFQIPRMEICRR